MSNVVLLQLWLHADVDAMKRSRSTAGHDDLQPKRKAPSTTKREEAPVAPHIAARPQMMTSFPRGGGTGLTPVEYRQSVLEGRQESAASDDLFQESSQRKRVKTKSTTQKKNRKTEAKTDVPKDRVRVELLNYKRLLPGTKVFGTILAIHPLALVVSICDQLLAHVPVTSVSNRLTDRLQSALDEEEKDEESDGEDIHETEEDEEEEEEEDRDDSSPPELHEIFSVGQWIRASVESVTAAGSKRQWGMGREGGEYERESQRVQLTMEPTIVNEGIRASDLSPGYVLSAAVQSPEDYGYTLDLGINDDVHGFLPTKDRLSVGSVVLVEVSSVDGRAVRCQLATSGEPAPVTTAPSQSAMLPGVPVRALITSHVPQGLSVKLFGMWDVTVDSFHVPRGLAHDDAALAPGKKIMARVLWNMPADYEQAQEASIDAVGARRIGLSCVSHVVSLETPSAAGSVPLTHAFPIGMQLRVRVQAVFREWGLLCEVPGQDIPAFVHISSVSDEHIDTLSATSGPWRVGTEHEARVTGHALTDCLLMMSMRASVLSKEFMRVSEVPIGQVVRVSIRKVTPKAIFVRMNGNVDGVVFPMHFSDVRLTHPEKKYKPNLELKARIIHTDPMRNRIVLTLKRSLITSDLPLLARLEDVRVGVVTNAVVLKQLPASMLVELGGTLRAIVPFAEASDTAMTSEQLGELNPTGKVVKVRITKFEPETGRIMASMKQASSVYLQRLNVDAVDVGERVAARFAGWQDDVAILVLEPSGTRALLSLHDLSRQRRVDADKVRASLAANELLSDLYVAKKNAVKGYVVLSYESPDASKTVEVGGRYEARVVETHHDKLYSLVSLLGTPCRARLHATECSDSLANATLPDVGDQCTCIVLSVRKKRREADVSIRPSRLAPSDGVNTSVDDPVVDSTAQLEIGMHIRGLVKAVTNHGVYVSLGPHTDARVMIKELFDEYVKDFRTKFQVGQCVRGTILQIEPNGQIELSLKKSRLEGVKPSAGAWSKIHEGEKVKAHVRGITEYGIFLQVDGTDVSGLCHKSELSDNKSANAIRAFAVGDRVKAVVLKMDADKRRVAFGLKPSYFDDGDLDDVDEDDDEDDEDNEEDDEDDDDDDDEEEGDLGSGENIGEEDEEDEDVDEDEDESIEEEEEDEDDGDDDEEPSEIDVEAEDVDVDGDASDDGDEDVVDDELDTESVKPKRSVQEGFRWGASNDVPDDDDDDDDDDDHDDDDMDGARRSSKVSKKSMSDDITADLATKKLDSAADFERVLLGSPNSSYLWIQFMTFYLQLGNVDKARQVARRAIQVIHFREEQEKLNVWMALLNVENMYGSPDTVEAVFKEAAQYNDALEVHLRMLSIYEHGNKIDDAAALFPRAVKKFSFVPDMWIRWYEFCLRHDREDEAHALVSRSLQSLDRKQHLRVLTAYALAEYKLGDVEHARTMFETLVSRYPKRTDIWWQYIDQEVRLENAAGARSLMERCLAARKHTTKQVKSLLQKWLVIEKRVGDEAGVQRVLDRARAFVASVQKRAAGIGDDDARDEDEDEEDAQNDGDDSDDFDEGENDE